MKSTGALCSRLKNHFVFLGTICVQTESPGYGKEFDTDFIVLDQKRLSINFS